MKTYPFAGIRLTRFDDGRRRIEMDVGTAEHAPSLDASRAPGVHHVIYDCGHSEPCGCPSIYRQGSIALRRYV